MDRTFLGILATTISVIALMISLTAFMQSKIAIEDRILTLKCGAGADQPYIFYKQSAKYTPVCSFTLERRDPEAEEY